MDSGCTSHMTGDKSWIKDMESYAGGYVRFGNEEKAKITARGELKLLKGALKAEVQFVEKLKHNLLSVSQLCEDGYQVRFNSSGFDIIEVKSEKVVGKGYKEEDLYFLSDEEHKEEVCGVSIEEESRMWHRRCGHINFKTLNKVQKSEMVRGLPKVKKLEEVCGACQKGK